MSPVSGKILHGTQGLGVPTRATVRQRAKELALIEGRTEVSEADWQRAFIELHGGHHDGDSQDAIMADTTSERDMVAPTLGHQIPTSPLENTESLGVELIAEGLDESAHDQMLQARRFVDLPEADIEA